MAGLALRPSRALKLPAEPAGAPPPPSFCRTLPQAPGGLPLVWTGTFPGPSGDGSGMSVTRGLQGVDKMGGFSRVGVEAEDAGNGCGWRIWERKPAGLNSLPAVSQFVIPGPRPWDPFRDASQCGARRWITEWILGSVAEDDEWRVPRMKKESPEEGRGKIREASPPQSATSNPADPFSYCGRPSAIS